MSACLPRRTVVPGLLESAYTVEDLLKRFVGGDRRRGIAESLFLEHRRYFRRRVRPLSPSFFPGQENSDDAIESLASGAFASFDREPTHEGRPAFQYAVDKAFSPPTGFLYFWRGSATILFLRREGPDVLRARANIQRNVRLHVHEVCEPVGRGAEVRWALPEWSRAVRAAPAPSIDAISIDLTAAGRGKVLIRAVLEAAGAPLTRAQISAVIERSSEFAEEVADLARLQMSAQAADEALDATVARQQLSAAVTRFLSDLEPEERQLLRDRGYAKPGAKLVSFRELAKLRPLKSAETYRKLERSILERLRDAFEPEDMPEVTALVVDALEDEP